jgi:hypothetical protein
MSPEAFVVGSDLAIEGSRDCIIDAQTISVGPRRFAILDSLLDALQMESRGIALLLDFICAVQISVIFCFSDLNVVTMNALFEVPFGLSKLGIGIQRFRRVGVAAVHTPFVQLFFRHVCEFLSL